jgi:hypothetical protein
MKHAVSFRATRRCVVLLCFILGMPMLHSYVAFAAITSIGVVGLYTSYLVSNF